MKIGNVEMNNFAVVVVALVVSGVVVNACKLAAYWRMTKAVTMIVESDHETEQERHDRLFAESQARCDEENLRNNGTVTA